MSLRESRAGNLGCHEQEEVGASSSLSLLCISLQPGAAHREGHCSGLKQKDGVIVTFRVSVTKCLAANSFREETSILALSMGSMAETTPTHGDGSLLMSQ